MLFCCIGSNERGVTIELGKVIVIGHPEGSKGWRGGESGSLPPMWLGFKSRRQRHMWVEFVVGSLLCSERFFFPGAPVFPSLQKPTFSNSNSTRNQVDEEALCGCATSKSLLINYLFIHSFICYNRSLIENR